jgi:hypothetical protein
MTDYMLDISPSSTMMIRDTGSWVEFWFRTGPSTWNNNQWWSWGANNTSSRQQFRLLRGGHWQLFGYVNVTYDQTIRFTIEGAGVGGWVTTDFYQHITRSTVPAPPRMISAVPISTIAIHVVFTGSYDGGSPVLEWEIGYGQSPNGPVYTIPSDGTTDISGFTTGAHWYFWARGRNALGWSPWSNRVEASTWLAPRTPTVPAIVNKTQTSVDVIYIFVVGSNDPPIIERQVGYGLDPDDPTDIVSDLVDGPNYNKLTNLDPGGTYYVWGRSRNSAGWSAWSVRTRVDLIAGARVLVGTEWKRAVPYVRDGGVWKVAEPWVKNAGIWRKTSV